MQSLLRLAACCISLLSLQQISASAAGKPSRANRLDLFIKTTENVESTFPSASQPASVTSPPAPNLHHKWLSSFLRHPPALGARSPSPGLAWALPARDLKVKRRTKRSRRHPQSRQGQNVQLMRVGCVLGTCQVQNLSHRLYQLIGQNGRLDSSPMNPKSPHSFG